MNLKKIVALYIAHGHKFGFASAEAILGKHTPVLDGTCYDVPVENRKAFVKELLSGSFFGTKLQRSYSNAQCPDCQTPIPKSYTEGMSCENCGHVFYNIDHEGDIPEQHAMVKIRAGNVKTMRQCDEMIMMANLSSAKLKKLQKMRRDAKAGIKMTEAWWEAYFNIKDKITKGK